MRGRFDNQQRSLPKIVAALLTLGIILGLVAIGRRMTRGKKDWGYSVTDWRGMHIDVGPEFRIRDADSSLFVRKQPVTQKSAAEVLVFKSTENRDSTQFETRKEVCSHDLHCQVTTNSAHGVTYECFEWQRGWLADSSYVAFTRCLVFRKRIEARYFCNNVVCDRLDSIVKNAFASLKSDLEPH